MSQITEAKKTKPTGLECNLCHSREMDRLGGLERILARGAWAQSMISRDRHVCGSCYRQLEPFAREAYWHRPITHSRPQG
jgi:hypothetical protein